MVFSESLQIYLKVDWGQFEGMMTRLGRNLECSHMVIGRQRSTMDFPRVLIITSTRERGIRLPFRHLQQAFEGGELLFLYVYICNNSIRGHICEEKLFYSSALSA